MRPSRRTGAALVLALLAIIVLDCIVLGTLHIAMQEHRIGANRSALLQLRLDTEGGARRALGYWTAEIDSMPLGGSHRIAFPASVTAPAQVEIERIDERLFLVESLTAELPPRMGRARARVLLRPPALPPATEAALVPVTSAGPVHITASGRVTISPTAGCAAAPPTYSVHVQSHALTTDPGAFLEAPAAPSGPQPVLDAFERLAELAPVLVAEADSVLTTDAAGVLLARGSITLNGTAEFRGLLVAHGSITIGPEAAVIGAVHARAGVTLAGMVQWDGCVVQNAIEASRLNRPTEAAPRAWLPAF